MTQHDICLASTGGHVCLHPRVVHCQTSNAACRADYVTVQYSTSVVKKYAEAGIPLEVFGTLKDALRNKYALTFMSSS